MVNNNLVGGWATYPSEKYDGVKVSWDHDIPNWMDFNALQ